GRGSTTGHTPAQPTTPLPTWARAVAAVRGAGAVMTRRIAPEPIVPRDLLLAEQFPHLEVRPQVHAPELRLQPRDLVERGPEPGLVDLALREEAVQLGLRGDEPGAQLDRLGPHPLEEHLRRTALLHREFERVGEVEDVPGPRVVVQLRDLREAHAFPAQIPLDLGLGERLDLAGLLRGERRGAGEHEGHDDEATHGSISSGSPANGVSVRRKITSCRSGRRTEDGAPGSGAVPPHAGPDEAPALQGRKVASPTGRSRKLPRR